MPALINKKKQVKGFTDEEIALLDAFIEKWRKGEISPFQEQIERARKNLRKAGLIK